MKPNILLFVFQAKQRSTSINIVQCSWAHTTSSLKRRGTSNDGMGWYVWLSQTYDKQAAKVSKGKVKHISQTSCAIIMYILTYETQTHYANKAFISTIPFEDH